MREPQDAEREHVYTETDPTTRSERVRERMEQAQREFFEHASEFDWFSDEGPGTTPGFAWPREFEDLFPIAARRYFMDAQRDILMAFSELLKHWIERSGGSTTPRSSDRLEKITIRGGGGR